MTLRNDSLFALVFSNSVSKTRVIWRLTIKIIEMSELHASMPPMRSAEYLNCMLLNHLTDIDECSGDSSACDKNARCINSEGSFSCTCEQGYSGNGTICKGENVKCSQAPPRY